MFMLFSFIFFSFISLAESNNLESDRESLNSKGGLSQVGEAGKAAVFREGGKQSARREESTIEKIKVTGSHIKRIDIEGVSPVIVYTKEDLENAGYLSLSSFLKNSSLSNFGKVLVHHRSTLTLINGKRTVYDSAVDLIPTSAIERVEILKDGASALYGSDVVGGVINIITKKGIDDNEFSLKAEPVFPFGRGGEQVDASFTFGKKLTQGSFASSFQFQYNNALKPNQRKKYYNDSFIPYSFYPNYFIGKKVVIVDEKCPENQLKNKLCQENLLPFEYIAPRSIYISNYSYLEHDLTSDLTFYLQAIGLFRDNLKADRLIIDALNLPAGHKMSQGAGTEGRLQYLFKEKTWDNGERFYFLEPSFGLKGYLSKTWDFDIGFKWSNFWSREFLRGAMLLNDLTEAVASGSYDPFNPEVRDLSSVGLHRAVYKDNDTRLFASADFSGEMWGGGDLAFGLQAYYNRYKNTPDPRVKAGEIYALAAAESGVLKRNVFAAYTEAVKVFNDKLELQAAWRADYYSDFGLTDFGVRDFLDLKSGQFEFLDYLIGTPKLALRFQPVSSLLLRASAGTSFDAPDLDQLNSPTSQAFIRIYDTVACYNELKAGGFFEEINQSLSANDSKKETEEKDNIIKEFLIEQESVVKDESLSKKTKAAFQNLTANLSDRNHCKTEPIKGLNKGNKDLNPVKAFTASLGAVVQISDNHAFRFDYWYNLLKGRTLNSLHRNKKTIDAELRYGKSYVEDKGVQYKRDENKPHNPIVEPVNQTLNLASNSLSGFDLSWESDFPQFTLPGIGGSFYLKEELAYVITGSIEVFPGMGFVNNLGKSGLPRWRNFATLGWKKEQHDLSFVFKSTAGTKKINNQFETLKTGHLIDLFYQYLVNPKTSFKVGFYNVFFLKPVIDDSRTQGAKFDTDFYSLRGPSYFIELRRKI